MVIPPEICLVLTYPAQVIPYAEAIAVIAILGALGQVLIALIPLSAELVPILGAALAGYEIHKHKLIAALLLYIIVSVAIDAGFIPLCGAA